MIVSRSEKLAFVHVPKTAGSTVTRLLKRVWPDAENVGPKHIGVRSKAFRELPDDMSTFAVVRDPWERCLSWFGMINRTRENVAEASTRFEELALWIGPRADEFETFVDLLHTPVEGEPRAMRLIRGTQYEMLYGPRGAQRVGLICRVESLERDLAMVLRRPEHLSFRAGGLGSSLRRRHNASGAPEATAVYTDELIEQVAALYADDIETFGYEYSA